MLKKTLQKLIKPKKAQVRRTGRSTAEALEILSKAIKNSNEWVEIYDHHHFETGLVSGLYNKISILKDMVKLLGLKGVVFGVNNEGKRSIKVNLRLEKVKGMNVKLGVFGENDNFIK